MSFATLLLQAHTDTTAVAATPEKVSLFHLLFQGGLLMIPLLICSVIMVYVFVERLLAIRRSMPEDARFLARVRDQINNGNLTGAKALCRNTGTPEARMLEKGISRIGKPIDQIEKSMESVGKLEVYQLEKNLSILS